MKDIESGFNILFLHMENSKKRAVGVAKVLQSSNGVNKIISKDLNVNHAVFYLLEQINL